MWTLNNIKFKILEKFIFSLWFSFKSQIWSHKKYELNSKILIIPKHKEISRWTLNNIFKIISDILELNKNEIENIFLIFINWEK